MPLAAGLQQKKQQQQELVDLYDEDEAEKAFLFSKPICFLIVGKPGTGKATLGRSLSLAWNCSFVEAKEVINYHIDSGTEDGIKIQDLLFKGHSVPEELVTELLIKKIQSPEVNHLGYVLCGLPSLSEEYMSIPEQIELIKNLNLKPDFIINIKCPDDDLCQRISGQKQSAETGRLYQREEWDPELLALQKKKKKEQEQAGEEETEEEAIEEEEEEEEGEEKQSNAFMNQLVQRPEDFPANAKVRVKLYKDTMLRALEDLMADHDSQWLIELDGHKKPDELFKSVMSYLESMGVRRGALVTRLQSTDEEETIESQERDELFRALSSSLHLAPRYRWRRSRWGDICPIALKEGYIKKGLAEFAVRFLDKMYLLSSEDALWKFRLNPRPYLIPPMPLLPCKVVIMGPPSSGKTTLCNRLADKYSGKVFDISVIIEPHLIETKQKAIEEARDMALQAALTTVKNKVEQKRILQEQEGGQKQEGEQQEEEERPLQPGEVADTEALEPSSKSEVEEVTADHPEVQAMVLEAEIAAGQLPVTLPPDAYAEVLKEAFREFKEKTPERFPGAAPIGGWVVDNFPISAEHWTALQDAELIPDTVICLTDTDANAKNLLNRFYLQNKDRIDEETLKQVKEERALKTKQEPLSQLEDMQSHQMREKPESAEEPPEEQLSPDTEQTPPVPEPEIVLPEVPEGGYPNTPEMDAVKLRIDRFAKDWLNLKLEFLDKTSAETVVLDIAGHTAEELLQEANKKMESCLKCQVWEMTTLDLDEEADDFQAEQEAEREEEEEEEREEVEEEEDEEIVQDKRRHYGDSNHFCPVTLKENFILFPGISDNAAKYREKTYYFSVPEYKDKFIMHPEEYVAHKEPLNAPPLRVFILGCLGAGKTTVGRWLAKKLGIFHIQFQLRLEEIMMFKFQKVFRPENEEDNVPEVDEAAMMAALRSSGDASTLLGDFVEETKKEEVVLTEDEEAIKTYLLEQEPLSPEILENIVAPWWKNEPIRSTGFILDGFPSTAEEVQYVTEQGLYPDIVLLLEVDENIIIDRLLPSRLAKWKAIQNKRQDYKQKLKEIKKKIRDEQISKRKAEILAERNKAKESEEGREGESSEEEKTENEEEDDIDLLLAEEFPEEEAEEEEEEEEESDAIDRMKSEIGEKFEVEMNNIQAIQEEFEKQKIPFVTIDGARKPHIVQYLIDMKMKHLVENRESLFEKCFPISVPLAKKMLQVSYKHLSNFGRWDPVKLYQGNLIKPRITPENPGYPLIHRHHIYFFETKENKETFMKNPIKFIRQLKPRPAVPVNIAIVGPPKSGKTTVAQKLASVYGLMRLSMGDAIRNILTNQSETQLGQQITLHLLKGLSVPDQLAIQCLQVTLMELLCKSIGFVLDGYPVTKRQVDLLEEQNIIPVKIFELQMDIKEVLKRGLLDKKNAESRPYPIHDSSHILTVRNSCYKQEVSTIKDFYEKQHQNWYEVDATRSKWWIWEKVIEEVQTSIKQIQVYLERIKAGQAASINNFCITPQELQSRLGEFGHYCPVSWLLKGELVDCSADKSLKFAAEFRAHYYRMASQEELDKFLATPEVFVLPLATRPFPPPNMLPKKLTVAEVKTMFPKNAEMKGYCPVTFLDGKQRYEALIPGNIEYAVEYQEKIYFLENEEKREKFMRLPEKYWKQILPNKLPPKKEPLLLTYLPLSGYLEQGVAVALIKALNEVGCAKPKFPFMSIQRSALLFIAYHLKAYNPRNNDYVRKKYKKQLEQFVEHCELIPYLGDKMTRKYREPQNRPIDFDHKLKTFISLENMVPKSL
ncbi:adenylate kinase 9 [Microcaecilia unicolor]|uniref:Adenylate kinase 9 n=1 Tax=Microcaecilia unicolor TaxID=1415580 RepID=A0A6P7XPI5_9AMPH|nr:adenylate kinase 9 [Microcaecilia unicolor]